MRRTESANTHEYIRMANSAEGSSDVCSRNCRLHQQMAFYHHALPRENMRTPLYAQLIIFTIIYTVCMPHQWPLNDSVMNGL